MVLGSSGLRVSHDSFFWIPALAASDDHA